MSFRIEAAPVVRDMTRRPPAGPFSDLEIRVFPRQERGYPVEITCSGEQEFPQGVLSLDRVPWVEKPSPAAEGEALFAWLFESQALRSAWAEARGRNPRRRIRLRLPPAAPELHSVPWELLRDPGVPGPPVSLAATDETPFSRYLAGPWSSGETISQRPIRMLAAIAAPEDLPEYGQAPLDVTTERRSLESAIAESSPGLLRMTTLQGPVTLTALSDELDKGYHILHLVAHGVYDRQARQPGLFLATTENRVERLLGRRLAELLARQRGSLRLVFLASCESGSAGPEAFGGLAPQLVSAGVPAVLAMQQRVAVETARTFAATFYLRLVSHGVVDLAANQARARVLTAELPGAAVPVLFSRLRSGQLFHRGQTLEGTEEQGPGRAPGAAPLDAVETKYELLAKLGEGGMGAIYKARHRLLDEIRIIKVMHSSLEQDEELKKRFVHEAQTASRLRHPNIVQVYDFAIEEGVAYIAMEFIEGVTLADLLKREGPPDLNQALEISHQVLQALHYLHQQDVVHRDIAPDNLMLVHQAQGRVLVKLIDLGIAKRLGAETQLTQTGAFLGKLRYASPEQFQATGGKVEIDARSDIYSFGIVLYQLLTGRFPIPGSGQNALIAGHLLGRPLDFVESDPQGRVPPRLRAIVLQAMAKEPQERFQTAEEFLHELERVWSQGTTDSGPPRRGSLGPSRPTGLGPSRPGGAEETTLSMTVPRDDGSTYPYEKPTAPAEGHRDTSQIQSRRRPAVKKVAVGLGLAGGALLLALALLVPRPWKEEAGVASPPGVLIVDAVPWGEVVAIRDPMGNLELLEPDTSTPLVIKLAPGTYEVELKPSNGLQTQIREVEVSPQEPALLKFELEQVDLKEYFQHAGW